PAVHGAPDRGAAQPRVPVAVAVAGVPAGRVAGRIAPGVGGVRPAEGGDLRVDAAVPAADAETRLRTRLADDPAQVHGAGHPVLLAGDVRRGVRRAWKPGLDVTARKMAAPGGAAILHSAIAGWLTCCPCTARSCTS